MLILLMRLFIVIYIIYKRNAIEYRFIQKYIAQYKIIT